MFKWLVLCVVVGLVSHWSLKEVQADSSLTEDEQLLLALRNALADENNQVARGDSSDGDEGDDDCSYCTQYEEEDDFFACLIACASDDDEQKRGMDAEEGKPINVNKKLWGSIRWPRIPRIPIPRIPRIPIPRIPRIPRIPPVRRWFGKK